MCQFAADRFSRSLAQKHTGVAKAYDISCASESLRSTIQKLYENAEKRGCPQASLSDMVYLLNVLAHNSKVIEQDNKTHSFFRIACRAFVVISNKPGTPSENAPWSSLCCSCFFSAGLCLVTSFTSAIRKNRTASNRDDHALSLPVLSDDALSGYSGCWWCR